jgi:hypothetical protein
MERLADSTVYERLPEAPTARREQFLSFFGQDLVGFRNDALRQVYSKLEPALWDTLLPYDQNFFSQAAASLSGEQREISRKLTERTITCLLERLMTMLSSGAPLGQQHHLRYRLTVAVEHCPREKPTQRYAPDPNDDNLAVAGFVPPDSESQDDFDTSGAILETHELTEGGQLPFPKYWHRWLNRYANY